MSDFTTAYADHIAALVAYGVGDAAVSELDRGIYTLEGELRGTLGVVASNADGGLTVNPDDGTDWTVQLFEVNGDHYSQGVGPTLAHALRDLDDNLYGTPPSAQRKRRKR